jgi:perosamine synthetase
MIKMLLCRVNKTLFDLMKIINENAKGVAFIVDKNNVLIGVMTDGDIRRLLLNGLNLGDKFEPYINKNCVFALESESYESLSAKTNDKVKILPIVNSQRQVIDFFELRNDIHIPVTSPDLKGNELKYLTDAFLSTWISSSGEYISRFEDEFSNYCDCDYGVAVTNGTVALHLALEALGVGEGDEVIVPDLTFAATINAVLHANATPVIVDIESDSWCIDPVEIEKAITPKTKAIIPVHIYGQACDMEAIMSLADKYNLFVIEDCAEAHGASYKGKKVGSFGHIGCFSFFGNKIITTGEGGMCVTNKKELDEKMRLLRDHGMSKEKRYWHVEVGYNYRMTNLQAAIGVAQLERIDNILQKRKNIENKYKEYLTDIVFIEFQNDGLEHRGKVNWLVSVLVKDGNRDKYMELLKATGIDVRPFFYPLSEMELYSKYVFSNTIAKEISKIGLNLPDITESHILEKVKTIFKGELNG